MSIAHALLGQEIRIASFLSPTCRFNFRFHTNRQLNILQKSPVTIEQLPLWGKSIPKTPLKRRVFTRLYKHRPSPNTKPYKVSIDVRETCQWLDQWQEGHTQYKDVGYPPRLTFAEAPLTKVCTYVSKHWAMALQLFSKPQWMSGCSELFFSAFARI